MNISWLIIGFILLLSEGSLFDDFEGSEQISDTNIQGKFIEKFASAIISTDAHEFGGRFSPDGKTFYFNRGKDICFSEWVDGNWTEAVKCTFNSDYLDNEPALSPDGKYLFFGSKRPHQANDFTNEYGIWVVSIIDNTFSEPTFVGAAAYITFTSGGYIYTRAIKPEYRKGTIVKTNYEFGGFTPFIMQNGGVVETKASYLQGVHPCIFPDEDYMIFTAMYKSWGNAPELFMVHSTGKDTWSNPVILTDVIGVKGVMTPFLSPDFKYLYFYYQHDIYRIELKYVIEYYEKAISKI